MKIRAVLFAVLATTLSLHAASRVNPNGPYDFSHAVPVAAGHAALNAGDSITIDAIHGSADKITVGNVYEVDGHYTLATKDSAVLAVLVTSEDTSHHPAVKTNSVNVTRGDGTFTVYFYMWHAGDPHISFYPDSKSSDSFGAVYFNGVDAWAKS